MGSPPYLGINTTRILIEKPIKYKYNEDTNTNLYSQQAAYSDRESLVLIQHKWSCHSSLGVSDMLGQIWRDCCDFVAWTESKSHCIYLKKIFMQNQLDAKATGYVL